jgi:hypothetical protein
MPPIRWVDRSQPQTLMMATVLMYLNAALSLLFGGALFSVIGAVLFLGPIPAGLGIANEKRWGYWAGVVLACLDVAWFALHLSFSSLVSVLFYGAEVALLLHPDSRSYRKIWFR